MGATIATRVKEALPQSRSRTAWVAAAVIVGVLVALYGQVVAMMVSAWADEPGASHGFLIPPMAAWIAWARRRVTFETPARVDPRGIWLTLLACGVYMLGRLGAEFFLTRFSLLMLLTALTWTFWGPARLRTLSFPLILLVTMIPVPAILYNAMAMPLQLFASDVATRLAQFLGVTVYRDGNIINLAQVSLGVAEACSGLHSLSALMVGSLLLGFLYLSKISLRLVLFAISIPVAIAANVLRVTGTAVLADFRPEWAMGFYHSFSGWLIFLVGFGLVFAFTKALAWMES